MYRKILLGFASLILFVSTGRAQLSFGPSLELGAGSFKNIDAPIIFRGEIGPSMMADIRFLEHGYFQSKTNPFIGLFVNTSYSSDMALSFGLSNPLTIGYMSYRGLGIGVGTRLGFQYLSFMPGGAFLFDIAFVLEVERDFNGTLISLGISYDNHGYLMDHIRFYFNHNTNRSKQGRSSVRQGYLTPRKRR